MAKDPVSGVEVDEKKVPAKSQPMGKTYYFCAPACKRAFDEDPAKYTGTRGHKMAGHGSHTKGSLGPLLAALGKERHPCSFLNR